MQSNPQLVERRTAEFVINNLQRKTQSIKLRGISSRTLPSRNQTLPSSANSTANSTSSTTSSPTPALAKLADASNPRTHAKTAVDEIHTAPQLRKASSKPKKPAVFSPLGVEPKTLRNAITRAINGFLQVDKRTNPFFHQLFESFYDIVNNGLAGYSSMGTKEYETFLCARGELSPYLIPDEEAMLDRLEKASFVH
jgi:hypothetical protein